jgi:hypothetical protein
MVSSYLVHHGYSSTAEKFAEITGQKFSEDLTSIKTRQSKMINLELSKMRFFLKFIIIFTKTSTNGKNWSSN